MFVGLVALSGCSMLQAPTPPVQEAQIAPAVSTTPLGAQGRSATALDTTTEAEKVAARSAPAASGERELGRATVALGPPAETGLWLRTPLVTSAVPGRIVSASGTSLAVELRPGTGGALLSLGAFQALGLRLTDLPVVTVYGP